MGEDLAPRSCGAGGWKATYSVLLDRFIGVLTLTPWCGGAVLVAEFDRESDRTDQLVVWLGGLAAGAHFGRSAMRLLEAMAVDNDVAEMARCPSNFVLTKYGHKSDFIDPDFQIMMLIACAHGGADNRILASPASGPSG